MRHDLTVLFYCKKYCYQMNIKIVCSFLIFCVIRLNCETYSTDFNQTLNEISNDNFDSYNNPSPMENHTEICEQYNSEKCASKWLEETQRVYIRNTNREANSYFEYKTNMNENNELNNEIVKNQLSKYKADLTKEARKFNWKSFKNATIKRIFELIVPTVNNKNLTIIYKINSITQNISSIQSKAEICNSSKTDWFDKKTDEWKCYMDQIGPKVRKKYIERRNLQNIGAKENGYNDVKQFSLWKDFEQKHFNETIMKVSNDIFPLYQQLHALIRHCLWQYFPNKFDKDGLIPIHMISFLFSNYRMCYGSNVTNNINSEVSKSLSQMKIKEMLKMPERFFESIGMFKMVDNFWNRSMFIKPKNKTVDCQPSSMNFVIGTDFRLIMCAHKNQESFSTMHHEMGHLEYYMAYDDLPIHFRRGANTGFHEAIGDTIKLSVTTPEYLKEVGLIKNIPQSKEFVIDYLMEHAMNDFINIQDTLVTEVFNWGVYNGSIPDDKLNKYWWSLNAKYLGTKPPVKRSENDFDPSSIYHIVNDLSNVGYFFRTICKFTFYESMCKEAGEYSDVNSSKPLHRCNFYGSKKAGKKFLNMLKEGKKQHWTKTMQILTGPPKPGESLFNGKSLMKYYQPLYDWLKLKNKELNIEVGWRF